MATQSLYISVEIDEISKAILKKTLNFKCCKNSSDLIYKNVVYIDDINNAEGSWWHMNICYSNFFDNCEALFCLCKEIEKVIPQFEFIFLGKKRKFDFFELLDFIKYVYNDVKPYKDKFENMYGHLSFTPKQFYKFRRKNKQFFSKTGDGSMS